jgi:hypothetical protein
LWAVRGATGAGLAVDAAVHAALAGRYDAVGAAVSEGLLFRLEAALAALAALLILLTARRAAWTLALVLAAGVLGTLLLYRYVDLGALGPWPNMYEPRWFPQKTVATTASAITAALAALGLITRMRAVSALSEFDVMLTCTSHRDIEAAVGILLADQRRRP